MESDRFIKQIIHPRLKLENFDLLILKSSKSWNTFLHLLHPKPPHFPKPLRAFLKEQTVQGTARSPVSILQGKFELRDLDVSLR